MERGTGVQPVPVFRGNKFPGRCCPLYDYQGKCYLKHSNKTVTLNYANFTFCNVHFKLSLVRVIILYLQTLMNVGSVMDYVVVFVLMKKLTIDVHVWQELL